MPSSNVVWAIDGSIATLTFNRPHARNALTWDMYDALVEACDRVDETPALRVLIIRGTDGSFSAGTDISQFADFSSGEDGIAYERRLDAVIDRLEAVNKITIAALDGVAVGGGCIIALACDVRACTRRIRFGVPMARTIGNCLSAANTARLVDAVGLTRATELLLTGRLLDADDAQMCGFAQHLIHEERFDAEVMRLARAYATRASSTIHAAKQMLRRIRAQRRPDAAEEILAACYGSDEFREGVRAFLEGREPEWAKDVTGG